jgi:hypothetical protein
MLNTPFFLLDHARLSGVHYQLADRRTLPAGLVYRFVESR